MNSKEKELLKNIYNECKKKQRIISMILPKLYDDDLTYDLNKQIYQYDFVMNSIEKKLKEENAEAVECLNDKFKICDEIDMNTVFDTTTEKIVDLLIKRSSEAMFGVMNKIKDYYDEKSVAIEMAEEFTSFEEKNIRIFKSYL